MLDYPLLQNLFFRNRRLGSFYKYVCDRQRIERLAHQGETIPQGYHKALIWPRYRTSYRILTPRLQAFLWERQKTPTAYQHPARQLWLADFVLMEVIHDLGDAYPFGRSYLIWDGCAEVLNFVELFSFIRSLPVQSFVPALLKRSTQISKTPQDMAALLLEEVVSKGFDTIPLFQTQSKKAIIAFFKKVWPWEDDFLFTLVEDFCLLRGGVRDKVWHLPQGAKRALVRLFSKLSYEEMVYMVYLFAEYLPHESELWSLSFLKRPLGLTEEIPLQSVDIIYLLEGFAQYMKYIEKPHLLKEITPYRQTYNMMRSFLIPDKYLK